MKLHPAPGLTPNPSQKGEGNIKGEDAWPLLDASHKSVARNCDGSYANPIGIEAVRSAESPLFSSVIPRFFSYTDTLFKSQKCQLIQYTSNLEFANFIFDNFEF